MQSTTLIRTLSQSKDAHMFKRAQQQAGRQLHIHLKILNLICRSTQVFTVIAETEEFLKFLSKFVIALRV